MTNTFKLTQYGHISYMCNNVIATLFVLVDTYFFLFFFFFYTSFSLFS